MYANWILQQNLLPWLEILSSIIEYNFDTSDRHAFEHGVESTNGERGRWFSYELAGRIKLTLQVAQDAGTEVLGVRVSCPAELEPRIDTATEIAKQFNLVR